LVIVARSQKLLQKLLQKL